MTTLDEFGRRLAEDRFLGVLVTSTPQRADPQVSVVNVAIIDHPVTGDRVAALVARPGAKLANLRRRARATVVARAGWEWAAIRGPVELSGPDDPLGLDTERQRTLLRTIFHAAGGHHDDLDTYDRVMLDERRCAVLIHPEHVWSNPPSNEHLEPTETGTET